jgi:hypothetical protein
MLGNQFGGVVIAAARERASLVGWQESDARLAEREHGKRNAVPVQKLERKLRRPVRITADRRASAGLVHRIPVEFRDHMKMHVDHSAGHAALLASRE